MLCGRYTLGAILEVLQVANTYINKKTIISKIFSMVLDRSFFGHGPGRLRSVGHFSVPLGSYVNSIKPISTSNITLSEAWALFFEDPTDQDNSRFGHKLRSILLAFTIKDKCRKFVFFKHPFKV